MPPVLWSGSEGQETPDLSYNIAAGSSPVHVAHLIKRGVGTRSVFCVRGRLQTSFRSPQDGRTGVFGEVNYFPTAWFSRRCRSPKKPRRDEPAEPGFKAVVIFCTYRPSVVRRSPPAVVPACADGGRCPRSLPNNDTSPTPGRRQYAVGTRPGTRPWQCRQCESSTGGTAVAH
jgi:hypothetical protein